VDPQTGIRTGAGDPRRQGVARAQSDSAEPRVEPPLCWRTLLERRGGQPLER
jgi:hypothetical protein